MKNLFKNFVYNILFFLVLIVITELILGSWFKSDSFGSTIRNGRLKDRLYEVEHNSKKYVFRYKKNFYGFRGEEVDPKKIKFFLLGSSQSNEKYKPEELTIVGHLNNYLVNSGFEKIKIYNASQEGYSSFGFNKFLSTFYPKIKNFNPEKMIIHIGLNDGELCNDFVEKEKNNKFNSKNITDTLVESNKIKRLKDYIKNNSFFVGKIKIIQLKYFNKKKQKIKTAAESGGDEYIQNQVNIDYIDHSKARKIHSIDQMKNKYSVCKESILNNLNDILLFSKKNNIEILFINSIAYKGLKDDWLFYTNLLIEDFANNNSLPYIDISKIKNFTVHDFYDNYHTTPMGSEKIAKFIYPDILNFLKNNHE